MGSSKSIIGSARPWMLIASFAMIVPAAFAQEPPAGTRDDVNATMGVIGDPNADKPDDIVRKISAPKSKRSPKSTDSIAKDLANPGKNDSNESGGDGGTSTDPGITTDPGTPGPGTADPQTPVDPTPPAPDTGPGNSGGAPETPGGGNGPDIGGPDIGGPDPHDIGGGPGQSPGDVRNHGEDVRRHHDHPPENKPPKEKPPKGPGANPSAPPPATPPSDPKPPGPKGPGPKGPGPRGPGPKPPETHPPAPDTPAKPPRDHQPPAPRNPGPRGPDVRPAPRPPRPG